MNSSISVGRWSASLLVGYFATSGLNWFVAEKILNPIIKPQFGSLMRDQSDTQIGVLVMGFTLPVIAVALLLPLMRAPQIWWQRSLAVGAIVSGATFFGAYTFLSGWLRLPTGALCTTAIADSVTIILGALLIGWIQRPYSGLAARAT